jgi:hypothetical protein
MRRRYDGCQRPARRVDLGPSPTPVTRRGRPGRGASPVGKVLTGVRAAPRRERLSRRGDAPEDRVDAGEQLAVGVAERADSPTLELARDGLEVHAGFGRLE